MYKELFLLTQESYEDPELDSDVLISDDVASAALAETKIEEASVQLSKAIDVAEEMENFATIIEQKTDSEFTPLEEKALAVAMEELFEAIEIDDIPTSQPTMEDSILDRVKARAKKIREQLQTIFRAILNGLVRMIVWIEDHFRHMSVTAGRLYKQANAMYKLTDQLIGEPKKTSYKNLAAAKRLITGKNQTIPSAIGSVLHMCVKAAEASGNYQYTRLVKAYQDFGNGVDPEVAVNGLAEAIKRAYEPIFPYDIDLTSRIKNAYKGVIVKKTDVLLGGYIGVMVIPEKVEGLHLTQFKIEKLEESENISEDIRVPDHAEIQKLLESCMQITSLVRNYEHREQPRLNAIKRSVEQAMNKAKNAEGKLTSEEMAFVKRIGGITPMLARGIHQQCFAFGIQSVRSILLHCTASMEAYGTVKK